MPASLQPSWDFETESAYRAAVVEGCRGAAETWVVAPYNLAQRYVTLVGTGFSVIAMDWAQLAGTLEQRLLLPHRPTASSLAWTAAMVRALRAVELPAALKAAVEADAVGVAGALSRSLIAVCEQAPRVDSAPAGGAFVRSSLTLLLALKAHVQADLARQGLSIGPLRWQAIAAALRAGPCHALSARLVLDGIDTLDQARSDAIAALSEAGVEIQAPPWLPLPGLVAVTLTGPSAPATPQTIVTHHRDVHEEVLGALGWVRQRMEAGALLQDLAIMVPSGKGYEPLLHEVFGQANLSVTAPYQPAVSGLREIQALRAYASIRSSKLDVVDLVTVLAGSEVVTGAELLALADKLYDKLPASLNKIEDLTPETQAAIDRLAMPLRDLRSEMAEFWECWVAKPDPELVQACNDVLETHLALGGRDGDLAGWPARLEALLDVPAKHTKPSRHAVSVFHAGPYTPVALQHLLVLGFCDGVFPGAIQPLPLLGASEIDALGQVGVVVPTPAARATWEMRNLWRMLGAAPDITLSVPERGLAGEALRPSPILEQITHLEAKPAPTSLGSLPEWQLATARGLAASDEQRDGLGAWAGAVFQGVPGFKLEAPMIERLFKTLSPSSIDVLLACPFAFYAKAMLRLKERPVARSLGWDAALAGTIGHRVLEVMLGDASDADLKPQNVGPTLERVIRNDFAGLNGAAYRIRLDLLRRELESFVARYAELATSLGASGGHSEWGFKFDMPLPGRARPVSVRGSIDRVMLRDGRPIAIDFKSGDVAKYRAQRAAGLGAQVAVYAWAIEQAGMGRPAAFAYLTLGGRKVEVQAIAAQHADLAGQLEVDDPEALEDFQERLQARLAAQLDVLEGGSIAPVSQERAQELEAVKAHPCRFCELELLCRSRQEAG